MMWFYILGTLLMVFFLLKNIHSSGEFKKYRTQAIFTFEDTRKSHKALRIIFTISFVAALVLLLLSLLVWEVRTPSTLLSLVCLTVGSFLFAFYPFTPGRWILTDHGIFIYNNNVFIPWAQIIGTEIVPRGKKTFLIINLKQKDGEQLKRTSYPVLVPGSQVKELANMIRDFVNMIDRKRYRKQFNEERSVPLKDRKFY